MKKQFLILFILLFSIPTFAADVTLIWDANTEPDLAGYNVYTGTESGVYGDPLNIPLSGLSDINNPEFVIQDLQDGVFHYFVVTAFDNEFPALESDYSNEVMCSNRLPPGTVINININCN